MGWNLENFRCCVGFVVSVKGGQMDLEELRQLLAKASDSEELRCISQSCSRSQAPPTVLGQWLPSLPSSTSYSSSSSSSHRGDYEHESSDFNEIGLTIPAENTASSSSSSNNNMEDSSLLGLDDSFVGHYIPDSKFQNQPIWITLTLSTDKKATLHSLYSVGCLYRTTSYIFLYSPPGKMDFFLQDSNCLVPPDSGTRERTDLEYTVSQINAAYDFSIVVNYCAQKAGLYTLECQHQVLNGSTSVTGAIGGDVEGLEHIWRCVKGSALGLILMGAWLWHSFSALCLAGVSLTFSSLPSRLLYIHLLQKVQTVCSLSDISFTTAYVHGRLNNSLSLLKSCERLSLSWSQPQHRRLALLQNIHSYVVFVWIDLMLGLILGTFMYYNAGAVIDFTALQHYWFTQKFLFDSLNWLKAGPAGVKLNYALTRMMEKVIGLIIKESAAVVKLIEFVHFPVIRLIACFGFSGLTTQLMLVLDVFRLITVHIAMIHRIMYFQNWVLSEMIKSLFLLFRGKKSNILRHRVDTIGYDSKQHLFGTVLFSMLLFLYPTFLAYYLLFTFLHMCIGLLQFMIWLLVVGLREFPYYLVFVRIFSPQSITHGIQFRFVTRTNEVEYDKEISTITGDTSGVQLGLPGGVVNKVSESPTSATSSTNSTSMHQQWSSRRNDRRTHRRRQVSASIGNSGAGGGGDDPNHTPYGSPITITHKQLNAGREDSMEGLHILSSSSSSSSSSTLQQEYVVDTETILGSPCIYLSISPVPLSILRLFRPYYAYVKFLSSSKNVILFFRGLLTGCPAFDLQLIQATVDLAGKYEVGGEEDESDVDDEIINRSTNPLSAQNLKKSKSFEELDVKELGLKYSSVKHATLTFAAAKEVRNQYYYSFWKSVSIVLGSKQEKFPLSLFYAALDISGGGDVFPFKNNHEQENGYYPASHIARNRRIDRNMLSLVLITYLGSFLCLMCGISILISSTILSSRAPHQRFHIGTNYSLSDTFSANGTEGNIKEGTFDQMMVTSNGTTVGRDNKIFANGAASYSRGHRYHSRGYIEGVYAFHGNLRNSTSSPSSTTKMRNG